MLRGEGGFRGIWGNLGELGGIWEVRGGVWEGVVVCGLCRTCLSMLTALSYIVKKISKGRLEKVVAPDR